MRRAILLFVKFPEPGRVKTRIAATAGAVRAAEIYRELVARVCASLPREIPVIVHFDPPEKRDAIIEWLSPQLPQTAGWEAQAAGDLGARLTHAFARAFADGWEHAAVIGSDCVEITIEIFRAAFEAPGAAIGPTDDGGYYLLALREPRPALFENIRWSTEHTLADTLARAPGLDITQLPALRDVDIEADWQNLRAPYGNAPSPGMKVK